MKTAILGIAMIFLTLTACSKDEGMLLLNKSGEVNLLKTGVPAAIKEYATTHFPASVMKKAVKETEDHRVTYEVELSDNVELEFNDGFQITKVDGESKLPNSAIPQAILDYVTENYPNNYISDWEIEDTFQEVELDNGIELEFTLGGVFIRTDSDQDDDRDDETSGSNSNTAAGIQNYVNTHFPSSTIIKTEKDIDDGAVTYEVTLSGNIELEFDAGYNITSIDANKKLPDSVIPQAIRNYVNSKYPNNFITDWELNDNRQKVELNNGVELEFSMNGQFIQVDND